MFSDYLVEFCRVCRAEHLFTLFYTWLIKSNAHAQRFSDLAAKREAQKGNQPGPSPRFIPTARPTASPPALHQRQVRLLPRKRLDLSPRCWKLRANPDLPPCLPYTAHLVSYPNCAYACIYIHVFQLMERDQLIKRLREQLQVNHPSHKTSLPNIRPQRPHANQHHSREVTLARGKKFQS